MATDKTYAEAIYLSHIKAFSLGSYKEPHNNNKIGKDNFIDVFKEIHQTISSEGFNMEKSILPLSSSATIINGAHRLASAIYSNQNVYCIKTELDEAPYNYNYFYERDVDSHFLDVAARTFIEFSTNICLLLALDNKAISSKKLNEILYIKHIKIQNKIIPTLLPDFDLEKIKQKESYTLSLYFYQTKSKEKLKELMNTCEKTNSILVTERDEIQNLASRTVELTNVSEIEKTHQKILYLQKKVLKSIEKYFSNTLRYFGIYNLAIKYLKKFQ
ncbi:MAG: hypothetical protein KF732_00630 [Flavobacteriales bacterium]|nr:hypothetical protein [Flavobacteriales bacterium]